MILTLMERWGVLVVIWVLGALAIVGVHRPVRAQGVQLIVPVPEAVADATKRAQNPQRMARYKFFRVVRVNPAALVGDWIAIAIPGSPVAQVHEIQPADRGLQDLPPDSPPSFMWNGRVDGGGRVTLVVRGQSVSGVISIRGRVYRIDSLGDDGLHAIKELDSSVLPRLRDDAERDPVLQRPISEAKPTIQGARSSIAAARATPEATAAWAAKV